MKQWIENLMTECGDSLYHFCYHLTGSKYEADDLFQETCLKAMEKEELLLKIMGVQNESNDSEAPFRQENEEAVRQGMKQAKNFLIGIAVRLWKYQCRKEKWRKRIVPEDAREDVLSIIPARGTDPEEIIVRKEQSREFQTLVADLPEKLRVVAVLYYVEELSTKEIAKYLGIPNGTVHSRLNHARKQMKRSYEKAFRAIGGI